MTISLNSSLYSVIGDNMKKAIIKFIFPLLVGLLLGCYLYKTELLNLFNTYSISIFQVGYYDDLNMALTKQKEIENSIIMNDGNNYRVVVSILKDENAIDKMANYLTKQIITYNIKQISISDVTFINMLNNYEQLLINSKEEIYENINKQILNSYI